MKFKSFAELTKYYREYVLFMTQEEFAEKHAGFSKETLKKWESGAIKKPSKTLVRAAFKLNEEYLRMAIDLLTDFEKEIETPIEVEAEFEDKSETDAEETEIFLDASPETLIQKSKSLIDVFKPKNKGIKKAQTQWVDPVHTNFNLLNNGLDKEIAGKVIGEDLIISATGNDLINGNLYLQAAVGSGKTRNFVCPNLEHNFNKNYLIIGESFKRSQLEKLLPGFDIKMLDLNNVSSSCSYNPFAYVKDRDDVIRLIDNFLKSTSAPDGMSGDPFFSIAEQNFYYTLGCVAAFSLPEEERNFVGMYNLYKKFADAEKNVTLADALVKDGLIDKTVTEDVAKLIEENMDKYFNDIAEKDPTNAVLSNYKVFKKSSPKTKKAILISADVKLWFMSIENIKCFLSTDEVDLENLLSNNKACVCVSVGSNDTYRFLAQTLLEQTLVLAHKMGSKTREEKRHLEIIINDIERYSFNDMSLYAATNRLFNYSFDFIGHMSYYGNQSEAKAILANCDIQIFYSANSYQEANYISTLSGIANNGVVDTEQLHLIKEDKELLYIRTLGCSYINKANPRIDI